MRTIKIKYKTKDLKQTFIQQHLWVAAWGAVHELGLRRRMDRTRLQCGSEESEGNGAQGQSHWGVGRAVKLEH